MAIKQNIKKGASCGPDTKNFIKFDKNEASGELGQTKSFFISNIHFKSKFE
jgi:hypothetical protein